MSISSNVVGIVIAPHSGIYVELLLTHSYLSRVLQVWNIALLNCSTVDWLYHVDIGFCGTSSSVKVTGLEVVGEVAVVVCIRLRGRGVEVVNLAFVWRVVIVLGGYGARGEGEEDEEGEEKGAACGELHLARLR